MYNIFKIENGRIRKYDYWYTDRMFFNRSKRRLSKIVKELNSRQKENKYVMMRVG